MLALPNVAAALVEPILGLLAGAGHRRRIVVVGGIAFGGALLVTALAQNAWMLLIGFVILYPASGAFVSLSQATLMDLDSSQRERGMALWTLAGSVGVTVGPLVLVGAVFIGVGWRGVYFLFVLPALPLALLVRRHVFEARTRSTMREGLYAAVTALRSWPVVRWLLMLEAGDAMGDLLNGYIALYAVDAVGATPVQAGLAVFAFTAAGLAGDALLLQVLRRVRGVSYLRISAALVLPVYPAFLLIHGFLPKLIPLILIGLLRAGWYALPQAGLYAEIPETSSSILILSNVGSLVSAGIVVMFGVAAQRAGIGNAMWILLLGPMTLLLLARTVPDR